MSAATQTSVATAERTTARSVSDVRHVFRAEARKLAHQLPIRLLALAVVIGPFAFAAAIRVTGATPGDTLFGMWVHTSGFAVPLVVLSFAGAWGFPVIAALVAGDMFSSEDRHGTWNLVLTRACSRGDVFVGKALAACAYAIGLLALATVASLVSGVLLVGTQPLVGLSGQLVSPGSALLFVLASWLASIPPLLAFTALALLISVLARNGIVGVLGPVLVALVMQLLALVGKGIWVHQALVLAAFDDWHGLFTAPRLGAELLVGTGVSVAWIAVCLALAWRSLRRRDFAGGPAGRITSWRAAALLAAASAIALAAVALAAGAGPPAVTAHRLEGAVKPAFDRLTIYQQRLLGRTVPPGAKLNDTVVCARRVHSQTGAGSDWDCTLNVLTPKTATPTPNFEPVDYDISVKNNGCWTAEGPPSFVGNQTFKTPEGKSVVNPLFRLEGCFNPL